MQKKLHDLAEENRNAVIINHRIMESQNRRTAKAGRDLKRPCGPAFCGKRNLDEIV